MYGIVKPNNSETNPNQMHDLRHDVDRIDNDILRLLAERRDVARLIAEAKSSSERPFHDGQREKQVILDRLATADRYDLDADLVSGVWEQIMAASLRVQFDHAQQRARPKLESVTVAIQGVEGSNSHRAALELIGTTAKQSWVSCSRFVDAVAAVKNGQADLAVLPIENTTSGAIAEVYDLLLDTKLSIVGEAKLRVIHCLLGVQGADLGDLKTVHGHPQAVAQCADFLATIPDVEVIYTNDTARAARSIAEINNPTVAAIAGEQAADLYNLEVIRAGINSRATNYTRFVAVSLNAITVEDRVPAKTSVVLSVSNEPGALAEVLDTFASGEIALVKLESRPMPDDPWQELFYLDFEGNLKDPEIVSTLEKVRAKTSYLRVLGSYPSRDLRPHRTSEKKPSIRVQEPQIPAQTGEHESSSYRLAGRDRDRGQSVIDVGGVAFGGPDLVMIAGPCAVESHDQLMSAARGVKAAGANVLRGGCFKPRTSPYSFQGLGWDGVDMLAEAGRVYSMPTITEVGAPEHVEKMAQMVDILQIGARNMQNFALLSEVGLANRPVLLKRGMSASIEELLQAAEYILAGGNQRVILCERGIRTFETSTRNTLDVTAVPVLKRRSHLPVIVDPSHAAGDRELVAPLALAAVGAGAHGLMVEVHSEPDSALSDGPQSLDVAGFEGLMQRLNS